jgi:hypothetical protein
MHALKSSGLDKVLFPPFSDVLSELLPNSRSAYSPPAEKSFAKEGEFLERALKKALSDGEEADRELAAAARRVEKSTFGQGSDFGQAHQALAQSLGEPGKIRLSCSNPLSPSF